MQKDLSENNILNSASRMESLDPFRDGELSYSGLLTPEQREIWIHMQIDPQATLCYNECVSIDLVGELNVEALTNALNLLCLRHESLRMTFSPNGKFFFIKSKPVFDFKYIDATENYEFKTAQRKKEQVESPLDLVTGPCFRVDLLKKSDHQWTLLLCLHHIICDGWSMSVLLNDLCYYYEIQAHGHVVGGELSQTIPFREYAVMQNDNKSVQKKSSQEYWAKEIKLNDHRQSSFAGSLNRSQNKFRTLKSDRLDLFLEKKQVLELKSRAKNSNVSLYNLTMALFQVVLLEQFRQVNESTVETVIGIAVAPQASGINTVGHLTRLLPFYQNLSVHSTLKSLIDNIRSKLFDVIDYQHVSYGQLLQLNSLQNRNPGMNPLFSLVFNIDQQAPNQGLFFSKMNGRLSIVKRSYENFELFINMVSFADEISFEVQYNLELFNQQDVSLFFTKLQLVINKYLQNKDSNSDILLGDLLAENKQNAVGELKTEFVDINNVSKVDDLLQKTNHFKNIEKLNTILNVKVKNLLELNNSNIDNSISSSDDLDIISQISLLWSKVLHQEIYSQIVDLKSELLDDHFFQVGGHSLLAIDLSQKIQEKWNIKFSVKEVFLNPSIRQLSSRLKQILSENSMLSTLKTDSTTKLVQMNKDFVLIEGTNIKENSIKSANHDFESKKHNSNSLSINQSQTVYLEKMNPGTRVHHLPAAFRVKTFVRQDILEQALNMIVENQEVLRTGIVIENGLAVRKVFSDVKLHVERQAVRESDLSSILQSAALFNFDLAKPPLLKVSIYDLGPHDCVVFILVHHAVWDGWSFDIFFEQLDKAYNMLSKGFVGTLDLRPHSQYSDFIDDQEMYFKSEKYYEDKQYWQTQLQQPLPVLEFPADITRTENISSACAAVQLDIPIVLQNKIRQFSNQHKTSLYNIFLTTQKIALAKYCSQDDVIIGSAVRGRPHQKFSDTLGFFVNILPLRTNIDFDQDFLTHLQRVQENCLQAYEHQEFPTQHMLMELNKQFKKNNLSTTASMFQTFFSYQDVHNRRGQFAGKHYSQINVDRSETYTDLDMWMRVSDSKIEGGFEYRKDIFNVVTMQRFCEYFVCILEQLITCPQQPLSNLQLPTKHLQLLEDEWSHGEKDTEKFVSFISTFQAIARKFPKKLAVIEQVSSLNYEQLDFQSEKLAIYLQKRGVGEGDLVGLCLSRNVNLLVSLLAVIKVGAGFVPMDPFFPKERLQMMVENSSAQLIITEDSFSHLFSNQCEILNIHEFGKLSVGPSLLMKTEIKPEQTFYVIYTSGSTGTPKGVEISHLSLLNFMRAMKRLNILTDADRLLAVTTFSFDISMLELLLPLFCGATVCLASREQCMDGDEIKKIIQQNQITVMQATPTTWRMLLASGYVRDQRLRVLCGGESFPKDLAVQLLVGFRDVWNMYGPTETTIWSTCAKLVNGQMITVGKPLLETSIFILDEKMQPVPIGVCGEVYISGRGVSAGYLLRPDLNKAKFKLLNNNLKSFATGDLGRWTTDGKLIILGRSDRQIKMRGYRIELGEIEYQLRLAIGVKEAVVFASRNKQQEIVIVAALVLKPESILDERSLRQFLSQYLPAYMIPSSFLNINEIPLTPNRKVDENKLREIYSKEKSNEQPVEKQKDSEALISASTNTEILRSIWRQVLKIDQILDEDNFFELGGYSLLAVQLATMIEDRLQLQVPLAMLIKAKDFAEFCRIVDFTMNQQKADKSVPQKDFHFQSLIEISRVGSKTPLLCFHGVGGNVLNYVQLIPALKNQRPLFAFQTRALDGFCSVRKNIEEMASDYIVELKQIQPSGPYILAGGSMGGMLALEVAQQLIKSGQVVEKLIMFDTFGPDINLKKYRKIQRAPFLKRLQSAVRSRITYMTRMLLVKCYELTNKQLPTELLLKKIQKENYQALLRYKPQAYPGDLYLIRSQRKDEGVYSDLFMGWRSCIEGKIFVTEIDSSHEHFIESPYLVSELSVILENQIKS